VHYFLMEPTGGDLARHDHEFEAVRWVPFDEAGALLTLPDGARPRGDAESRSGRARAGARSARHVQGRPMTDRPRPRRRAPTAAEPHETALIGVHRASARR
jgi:hypothetical protein